MKTIVFVKFDCGYEEIYSTVTAFIKRNKNMKLNAQTIRNGLSEKKGTYHGSGFTLKRFTVLR